MPDDKPAPFIPLTLPGNPEGDAELVEPVISASLQAQTREVLRSLTPREEAVLRERFGIGPAASDEPGPDFEITRQRIREIEARALAKLRQRRGDDHDE